MTSTSTAALLLSSILLLPQWSAAAGPPAVGRVLSQAVRAADSVFGSEGVLQGASRRLPAAAEGLTILGRHLEATFTTTLDDDAVEIALATLQERNARPLRAAWALQGGILQGVLVVDDTSLHRNYDVSKLLQAASAGAGAVTGGGIASAVVLHDFKGAR